MNLSNQPDFTLRHPAEIAEILDRLRNEKQLATIEFGDGDAIVSSLLEIRRDANALVFDIGHDAETSRRLFAADTLAFVAELDHIQIAFETRAPSMLAFADGAAAVVDLPTAVTRLQRREWFRAALPLQPPIRCTVLDADGNASPGQAVDLSCGGTGLVVDDPALQRAAPGSDHELILSIPDLGRVEIDATLRSVRTAAGLPGDLSRRTRLGFRFDRLPPKTANKIQRYVQRLEVTQLRVLKRRG